MGFEILSIGLLVLCIVGIIIIILHRLPDALIQQEKEPSVSSVETNLEAKGLKVSKPSFYKTRLKFYFNRFWNFLLEAKGLKPSREVGYKLKKIWKKNPSQEPRVIIPPAPVIVPEVVVKNEDYYLDKIKNDPKNLDHYRELAGYYLEQKNYNEARDVFIYLSKHLPGDSGILARLAFCHFHLKEYAQAVEFYSKSISIDSTQPNRYFNLALCHEALLSYDKAKEALTEAIKLEPENQKYRDVLLRVESRTQVF